MRKNSGLGEAKAGGGMESQPRAVHERQRVLFEHGAFHASPGFGRTPGRTVWSLQNC